MDVFECTVSPHAPTVRPDRAFSQHKRRRKRKAQLGQIGLVRMTYGGKVISASSNPTNDLPSLISFFNY